jgi:4-diphosphocytidyl-2-C-methyl-D-erythritol kinase
VKAWQCLAERFGIAGINIELEKNIPPGSGLGGGSSNAACILKGLTHLYNLNISLNDLLKIGSLIGADVPFFIEGGCQIGSGIGDQLVKVDHSIKNIFLLVMPDIHIGTKTTFKKFKKILDCNKEKVNFANFIEKDKFLFKFFENDFETIIVPAYPEVGKIKKKLLSYGAVFSSLSGTGSTVYGVFDDEAKAISAESLFKVHYKTCIAHPVKIV